MLGRLAGVLFRRRRLVWVGAIVFVVVAGAFGAGVQEHLSTGGFEDPGAESAKANALLADEFGQQEPNLVMVVTANGGTVDDPANAEAGNKLTAELAGEDYINFSGSYWTLGSAPPLKSVDSTQALLLAQVKGTDTEVDEKIDEIVEKYNGDQGTLTVSITGQGPVFHEVGTTIEEDLRKAETLALGVTVILLIFVFGGLVAASLPLAIGIIAIVGSWLALRVIAELTEVSVYVISMTTIMGLGLAIDYALFVLSRFREELGDTDDVEGAVRRTMKTAGRTVIFSAITVAVSLSALLIFPLAFLRSFAYAGIAVVAVACAGAVIVLPAILAGLGRRVDALSFRKLIRGRKQAEAKSDDEGFWHRLAIAVMKRPWPFAIGVTALLLALGAPFLNLKLGTPDDRVLPPSAFTRTASDQIRNNFSSQEAFAVQLVTTGIGNAQNHLADIEDYATRLSQVDGVARVDSLAGSFIAGQKIPAPEFLSMRFAGEDGTWLSVVPAVEPVSLEGEKLVKDVRNVDAPFDVLAGGPSAELVDSKDSLFRLLPIALGMIAVISFVALFLMFGGLLVPIKAVVLNLLSLTATFGAMVYIFQDGHGSGLLDFTTTGTLVATTPILMFCIAFGLSMDYEVFLLSRIKEEHDISHDNEKSVAIGLEKTGRIVTAAALLLAVVFLATVTSQVSFIKLFGLGMAMAVVMDATLIRGLLVPAFMRLAGEANWWAPKPLQKVYERFGFSEGGAEDPVPHVVDVRAFSDRYRTGMVRLAEQAASAEELHALLAEENLTVDQLIGWGAKLS